MANSTHDASRMPADTREAFTAVDRMISLAELAAALTVRAHESDLPADISAAEAARDALADAAASARAVRGAWVH